MGTGSLRGLPVCSPGCEPHGFRIWPFHDAPALPVVVEIYPRLFTGPVVKSDASARAEHLRRELPELDREIAGRAIASEDAFDALLSARAMAEHSDELAQLPQCGDTIARAAKDDLAPRGSGCSASTLPGRSSAVRKFPWVQVPAGEIGVVIAQVGAAAADRGQERPSTSRSFGNFSDPRSASSSRAARRVCSVRCSRRARSLPIHPVAFLVHHAAERVRAPRVTRPRRPVRVQARSTPAVVRACRRSSSASS